MTFKRALWIVGLSVLTMFIGNHVKAIRDDAQTQLAKSGS